MIASCIVILIRYIIAHAIRRTNTISLQTEHNWNELFILFENGIIIYPLL